jgi:TatD DNase family protein
MSAAPTLPDLVDSHCHLTWESFDEDRDAVIGRMRQAGVGQAVVVATSVDDARRVAELCRRHDGLYATAGIHPNDVPEDADASLRELQGLLREGEYVAVGETGLDYYRDWCPPERQRASFRRQAAMAVSMDLPVVVHVRDPQGSWAAHEDVLEILREQEGVRGVIHCFSGDAAHAIGFVEAGMFVSFAGVVTFPNGKNVRDAAEAVPIERMLVETDAPFLAPVPHRGRRNEPAYVAEVARALAPLKGLSEADVRTITTRNARGLFGLSATRGHAGD